MEKKIATTGELARMLKASETTSASMKDLITGVMGLDSGLSHGIASSEAFGREMMGGGIIAGGALSPLWAGALASLATADTMAAREAATTATTATSASDLLDKIKKTKAELAALSYGDAVADAGDASGWKMTSVRWLKERHPEYVRGGKGAHAQLSRALAAMSYCDAEAMGRSGRTDRKGAAGMRELLLSFWDVKRHENMVEFLAEGGFSARVKKLGKVVSDEAADYTSRSPEDELNGVTALESSPGLAANKHGAPKPAETEQSLDDVVRELGNPTTGSW